MKQRLARKTCSKEFRELIKSTFPRLKNNTAYWRMLQYILYGTWRDETSNNLVISRNMLAKYNDAEPRMFNSGKFLEAFSTDIIRITYTQWSKTKSRELISAAIPEHIKEALQNDRMLLAHQVGLVDFVSGNTVNNAMKTQMREVDKRDVLENYVQTNCKEAIELLEYMNALDTRRFSYISGAQYEAALHIIQTSDLPESAKNNLLDVLRGAQIQPKPFYSTTERSVRIYPRNDSILNLPKDARKKLTEGLLAFDLRSAQLAVISKTWNIPELHTLLKYTDIWTKLFEDFGIAQTEQKAFKSVIKKAMYAIVFGMAQKNLVNGTKKFIGIKYSLPPFGVSVEAFLNNRTIKSILNARGNIYKDIRKQGGAYDAFGNWVAVTNEVNETSVSAQVAQSFELRLLYPVVQLARVTQEFTITYWLHDGFFVSVNDSSRISVWIKRMSDAVNSIAHELDIPTCLQIEY